MALTQDVGFPTNEGGSLVNGTRGGGATISVYWTKFLIGVSGGLPSSFIFYDLPPLVHFLPCSHNLYTHCNCVTSSHQVPLYTHCMAFHDPGNGVVAQVAKQGRMRGWYVLANIHSKDNEYMRHNCR